MIERLLQLSIRFRWAVVGLTLLVAAFGVTQLLKVPIDAVPDITNKQVQINTTAPALGPLDMERLVTFPVETAMAGIPGLESTRSISRNGFSQVTAIFEENVDLYFARQQVAERLHGLPEVRLDPGLREIDVGLLSGKVRREIEAEFPDYLAALRADPWNARRPGGESMAEVLVRVGLALDDLVARHPGEEVVIFSHGGAIRAAVAHALAMDAERALHISVFNLSLTRLERLPEGWRVSCVNEMPGV